MDDFVKGTKVRVDGLVSDSALRHNGKVGKIVDVFPDENKVRVILDSDSSDIKVATGKLTLIQPAGRPAAGSMDLGKFGELKIGELKVGTRVLTVAIVEPYPEELTIMGYVEDISPDGTMVTCRYVPPNPPNEKQFFVVNIKNLRVAPKRDDERPLSLAIDISRPSITTQKRAVLEGVNVKDLSGIESMKSAEVINLSGNKIDSLEKVVRLPPRCLELNLSNNQIASLENVVFVSPILRKLDLQGNKIERLDGVKFPDSLRNLDLSDNQLTSVVDTVFPASLKELRLDGNLIPSIEGLVLPTNLESLKLSESCKVSEDFLLKYEMVGMGKGPLGPFVGYELVPTWSSMQKLFSDERGEIPKSWEHTGDPGSVVSALLDRDALGTDKDTVLANLESLGQNESAVKHLLSLKPRDKPRDDYSSSDTTKALSFPPPPPRPPASLPSEADARSKTFLEGTKYSYNNDRYKTLSRPRDDGEHGGSKTRRRQGRRQSKRNKMQRKNKYSRRRRRNAKSRSK